MLKELIIKVKIVKAVRTSGLVSEMIKLAGKAAIDMTTDLVN